MKQAANRAALLIKRSRLSWRSQLHRQAGLGALPIRFQVAHFARPPALDETHPGDERGWVPPDQFITIAEEVGLISELGDHLLRQACVEAQRSRESCKRPVILSNSPVMANGHAT